MHRDGVFWLKGEKKVWIVSLKITTPSTHVIHIHNATTVFFPWSLDFWSGTSILKFEHEHNDFWITTLDTNSPQALAMCFFSPSYLFKHFSSACSVSKNSSDVITNNVTSLLKPVIPSWLRWRYWFDWDCMQINRDIGRGVVFQFAMCLWFQRSSRGSPPRWFDYTDYSIYMD